MEDVKIIVGDSIIKRMTMNQSISIPGMYHTLLSNEINDYPPDEAQIIIEFMQQGDSWRDVRVFLSEQEYIEETDSHTPKDKLTDKGNKAKQLGGHRKYLEWERKETDILKFENFPRKKWLLFELLKGVFLILLGAFINQSICNKSTDKNVKPTTLTVDTIYLPQPSQSLPETSDKKDSLP